MKTAARWIAALIIAVFGLYLLEVPPGVNFWRHFFGLYLLSMTVFIARP